MAGDWIKMRCELQTHPKIVRILSAIRPHDVQTRTDKFRVIGGLHAVWSVFDAHSDDGSLFGYTPETMDHVIGWDGFSQALIDVEWLLYDGVQTIVLPEFLTHNGKSGKRRAEDQKRKRDDRKSPQSVRNLSASEADKMRTREEKRREDKSSTDVEDKRSRNSRMASKPEGVTDAVWSDFLAIRKAKKAPLTSTALAGIEREAKAAGLGLADALALCCARGWQGFKAEWVRQAGRPVGASAAESYAERTERMHRERVAEFMGRPAEEAGADIIDVTPRIKRLEG